MTVNIGNRRPHYRCQVCTSWSRRAELVAAFVIEYLAEHGPDRIPTSPGRHEDGPGLVAS
ncbi:hypothetical protein AB0C29_03745 [Actinoplanes sp. NPDC048791]|uniref:hypothetical protein n=1 Tax=Actinoplanes sp. NPDC048791 TaxID=3154623 RepID=UPI0033CE9C14